MSRIKITKELLLQVANECRSFKEMSIKIGVHHTVISKHIKLFNILAEVRVLFLNNRKINPLHGVHNKESILNLARNNTCMAEIGRKLNLSRERVRQIINKLGIKEDVETIFDMNKYGIVAPKNNVPAVFSLYFKNDLSGRKFFAYSRNFRDAIIGYYRWLKDGKKISHPLIQFCKKYGINNFQWELIKECPVKDLRKEAHKIVLNNIGHSMNLRATQSTPSRRRFLLNRRIEKIKNLRQPKKSKYDGVYYHRFSGLWTAKPMDPVTLKQKYLGYWPTEEKAHSVIKEWLQNQRGKNNGSLPN